MKTNPTPEPITIATAIAAIQSVTEKNNNRIAVLLAEHNKRVTHNAALRLEHAELLRKADEANRLR